MTAYLAHDTLGLSNRLKSRSLVLDTKAPLMSI